MWCRSKGQRTCGCEEARTAEFMHLWLLWLEKGTQAHRVKAGQGRERWAKLWDWEAMRMRESSGETGASL